MKEEKKVIQNKKSVKTSKKKDKSDAVKEPSGVVKYSYLDTSHNLRIDDVHLTDANFCPHPLEFGDQIPSRVEKSTLKSTKLIWMNRKKKENF